MFQVTEGVLPDRGGERRARTKLKTFNATRPYTGRGVSRLILSSPAPSLARRLVAIPRHRMSPPPSPGPGASEDDSSHPSCASQPATPSYILYGVSIRFLRRRILEYSFLSFMNRSVFIGKRKNIFFSTFYSWQPF